MGDGEREAARQGVPDSGEHVMEAYRDGAGAVWYGCRVETEARDCGFNWPCRPALLAWVAALTDACDVSRRALRWYGRHQAPCRREAGDPCICGYDVVLAGASDTDEGGA